MTARSVQTLIETQLEPVSSFALAPSAGKNLTVLIDDLNAGTMTLSPSSSCSYVEYLRFLTEYWMWYDIGTGALIAISVSFEILAYNEQLYNIWLINQILK